MPNSFALADVFYLHQPYALTAPFFWKAQAMKLRGWALLVSFPLLMGAVVGAPPDEKETNNKQTKADLATFRDFLVKNKLDKQWQGDPARVDSEEIRKAYGKRRVYYTSAAPPLPPGAKNPELDGAYKRRLAEYQKNSLKITVTIDEKGKLTPLRLAEEFNAGLMPVKSDGDARIAAAAILTMYQCTGLKIAAKDIDTVKKTDKGWLCSTRRWGGIYELKFNAEGKCTAVTQFHLVNPLLLPPSTPGGPAHPTSNKLP
jgi:hypothetical protein